MQFDGITVLKWIKQKYFLQLTVNTKIKCYKFPVCKCILAKDTKVKVEGGKLILTGPKGSKQLSLNDKIFTASLSDKNDLILNLIKKNEEMNILWGTTRSILNNAVIGVSVGHEKILELSGVGYRAMLKGNTLNLQLGFSHDTSYEIPKDVKLSVEKSTIIKITGIDKELVGKVASEIKKLILLM